MPLNVPEHLDDVAYCIEDGCHEPTIAERPFGVTHDGSFIVELVCHRHDPAGWIIS